MKEQEKPPKKLLTKEQTDVYLKTYNVARRKMGSYWRYKLKAETEGEVPTVKLWISEKPIKVDDKFLGLFETVMNGAYRKLELGGLSHLVKKKKTLKK